MSRLILLQAVLLLPYFGWGVYALHRRYRYHEHYPPHIEAVTLLFVVLFFAVQAEMLHPMMREQADLTLFAMLGLVVSAAALYGHMAVSLSSRVLVELVTGASSGAPDRPRMGPAQALERRGDYEGAVQEYLVLARIFPRDPEIHCCVGENYLRLDRPDEALAWFQRALRYLPTADAALPIVRRVAEVHERTRQDRASAQRTVHEFLDKYPGTPEAAVLAQYGERLAQRPAEPIHFPGPALDALDAAPLASDSPAAEPAPVRRSSIELVADDAAAADPPETPRRSPSPSKIRRRTPSSLGLERMEDVPAADAASADRADVPVPKPGSGLRPMGE